MSFISNPSWLFLFMEPGQFMTLVEVSLGSGVIKGGSDFTVWIIYLELVPPFWLPPSLTRPSSWSDITVVSRLKKIYLPKLLGLADSSTALEDRLRTVDKRVQVALTIPMTVTWLLYLRCGAVWYKNTANVLCWLYWSQQLISNIFKIWYSNWQIVEVPEVN